MYIYIYIYIYTKYIKVYTDLQQVNLEQTLEVKLGQFETQY